MDSGDIKHVWMFSSSTMAVLNTGCCHLRVKSVVVMMTIAYIHCLGECLVCKTIVNSALAIVDKISKLWTVGTATG